MKTLIAAIFILVAVFAVKYDDTFCQIIENDLCDITSTFTACSETVYYYGGNATALNITGNVDLSASRN